VGAERPAVHLTPAALSELGPGEALVFDWVRVAMCCGAAGEVELRKTTVDEVMRSGSFVPMGRADASPVFAHRRAYSFLADQEIEIDCRKRFGIRHFTHDLPPDFGLRAVFGRRRSATDHEEQPWPQHPAGPTS
jgi:hypothetical protein